MSHESLSKHLEYLLSELEAELSLPPSEQDGEQIAELRVRIDETRYRLREDTP
jgi:hypothetical protein